MNDRSTSSNISATERGEEPTNYRNDSSSASNRADAVIMTKQGESIMVKCGD